MADGGCVLSVACSRTPSAGAHQQLQCRWCLALTGDLQRRASFYINSTWTTVRTASRISLSSVLLSFDRIVVGIAGDDPPTADEDHPANETVDPGLVDRMNWMQSTYQQSSVSPWYSKKQSMMRHRQIAGQRMGLCCPLATVEMAWQHQMCPEDQDTAARIILL